MAPIPDHAAVLNCAMDPATNDAGAASVREFLIALLKALWAEGDGFSSKRPLGNSDWQGQVWAALIRGGVCEGSMDGEWLDDYDPVEIDKLIFAAIEAL